MRYSSSDWQIVNMLCIFLNKIFYLPSSQLSITVQKREIKKLKVSVNLKTIRTMSSYIAGDEGEPSCIDCQHSLLDSTGISIKERVSD